MIYNYINDNKLSLLGFGTMRLPVRDGVYSHIDEEETAKMFEYAYQNGINYFDTAWGYHDGQSEVVCGKILKRFPRHKINIATKFPGYDLDNMSKVKEIFKEQLKKCQVDYFDYYLFHNVCEMNIDAYLDPKYNIYQYLLEQKERGKIKHLGLSVHGSAKVLERFLEAYGENMEFCQIQLNWLDWDFQDAKKKVDILRKHNIPIWVMEPLRGGMLVNIPEEDQKQLKSFRPNETMPGWAFRFLQAIPDVAMILSGMSTFAQLEENIKIFNTFDPSSDEEADALKEIALKMTSNKTLPCTECRYCTSHCPMELDIPELIKIYNEHNFSGGGFIAPMLLGTFEQSKLPSACIGCRSCEAVCPQQIQISEMMSDFTNKLKR